MAFFFYRKTGGQVESVSVNSFTIPVKAQDYFAQVENPTAPDGTSLVPAKVYLSNTLRNATAEEIAAFPDHVAADDKTENIKQNKEFLDDGNHQRPALKAIATVTVDEINTLRAWITAFKVEVAAAASLADLKTRVASLSDLNARTAAQVKTAIKDRMDSQA